MTGSQAQLVQVYCGEAEQKKITAITALISAKLPMAIVVGATTIGEVAHGQLITNQTVIGFTFFESSRIKVVAMACYSDELGTGAELGRRISQSSTEIAGILLLSTPLSIDASKLLQGIESTLSGYPIFGGGAGDYSATTNSLVFSKTKMFDRGAIAVIFCGRDLHVEATTYLGWQPLSRAMRITQADGLNVLQVDDKPAFDVYHRYLDIPSDEQFFLNALEFPFLLEREDGMLARVPVATNEGGALRFVADIKEGETFRIGYGDIDLIIENSKSLHQSMAQFFPQVVFLYTCGCRRFLMQESVELETLPLQRIAPTFGFYTYGEFFGTSKLTLLNSTMVAVGLREGSQPKRNLVTTESRVSEPLSLPDPYANKHTRIVSRLLRFIDAVTSDLEASIEDVTRLSITDQLTQLANRMRLDQVLDKQIKHAKRYDSTFSIILLDVDYFKQVNDKYGHIVGDDVLIRIAQTLIEHTRDVDIVGRWGGEEFLIIAPSIEINCVVQLAEKLRVAIESVEFPAVGRKTASFGVAEFQFQDDPNKLVARADEALYEAKRAGRNCVKFGY
ncbi:MULTISPECIES: sensor domain-containing diguanylate cyclase [Pseudoalteromonas]|nr:MULTISPECIES: diguanylate cyclase [Pseudoalteromonas]MCF6143730.1 diguanylate cyclase [Pseudoalteromonas mariniglutinosa NCIMB 1770]